MRKQDGYVTRPDGTDLGDTDTFTAHVQVRLDAQRQASRRRSPSTTRKSDENGSPLVFAAINEAATFPRVASPDAGCPGLPTGSSAAAADSRCR